MTLQYDNPAMNWFHYDHSLTELEAGGIFSDEEIPYQVEKGDGVRGLGFKASSYSRIDRNNVVWGEASYYNGRRRNVTWNENSDYDKIGPYVMADSLKGDIDFEHYLFDGGYARAIGRWTLGAEFRYRASLEYRKIDPRPRNLSAEISADAGASVLLGPVRLGLSATAGRYRQNSTISYYNELGLNKTFQLTGLGSSYLRFDGARNAADYEGYSYGGSFSTSYVPANKALGGITASISYLGGYINKRLPDLNDLDLTRSDDSQILAEIGWMRDLSGHTIGAKAVAKTLTRKGTENIFGDAAGNEYRKLTSAQVYRKTDIEYGVTALYEGFSKRDDRINATAGLLFRGLNEKQHSSGSHMSIENINIDASASYAAVRGRNSFEAGIAGTYTVGTGQSLTLGKVTAPFADRITRQNFRVQSSDAVSAAVAARWGYQIHRIILYIGGDCRLTVYSGTKSKSTMVAMRVGIAL